jgi:tetratricopeptide (TPR) repeat protein/CHAT domain-containing protein
MPTLPTVRRAIPCVFALVLIAAIALPASAQESPAALEARWKQLEAQIDQLTRQGKYAEALPVAQEALHVAESLFGSEHPNTAQSLNSLAQQYRFLGKYGEADPLYKRALAIREKALGPEHPDVAFSLNSIANLYLDQGRYAEAEPLYKRSLAIREKALGPEHPDVASSLNNLANVCFGLGRYADAEPLYKRSLAIAEKALGPEDPSVAQTLRNLAVVYYLQGRYAEAEPLYTRSLAILEKALGPEHPDVATSLNNLGALYVQQQRYGEAEPLYKRALAIREKTLGPEHPDVAGSLQSLAILYHNQGRYSEAEPMYTRSLAIYEKTFGPDRPLVAKGLNNLANLYRAQGRYAEAETMYRRSLTVWEKALGPDHPDVALSLDNLANLYRDLGRYSESEPLYKRALAIREKVLGPEHPDVAQSLNDLANLYRDQGRYVDAEPVYKRAIDTWQKAVGPDHPLVAASLQSLGTLYQDQGEYAKAEPLYKRSLAIQEKALGPEHPDVAGNLNNLANLYRDEARYADAEPLYKRALAVMEKAFGPDHPDVALALNNLASLYSNQMRYAEAESLCQRSLTIWEKFRGPDDPDVALSLGNLASLYALQGRFADAEPLYKRSLAIREKALGPEHPDVAHGLSELANLYLDQGQYALAEPLYKRALAVREKALGANHPEVATNLEALALLYRDEGNYPEAERMYRRAMENISQQLEYSFTYMSEKDRLSFLGAVSEAFPAYFSFCLAGAQTGLVLSGQLYDTLLLRKGLVASSVAALRSQIAKAGDNSSLALFDELSLKRRQLAAFLALPSTNPEEWRKTVDRLQQDTNDLEQQLVRRSSALAGQKKLAEARWQDVQRTLGTKQAAVEFVRFPLLDGRNRLENYKYAALVLTPNTPIPKLVLLGDAANLEAAPLQEYRRRLSLKDAASPSASQTTLYAAFWKPLEPTLGGAKRIYVSPDGVLNQIALGVLADDRGTLLIEKYDLRILSSTKDLLRSRQPSLSKTAVLVGNPKFDLSADSERAALENRSAKTTEQEPPQNVSSIALTRGLPRAENCPDLPPGGVLCALPGTETEVQTIETLLKRHDWQVEPPYIRDRALKELLRGIRHPRVLHIATHGYFEPDQSSLKSDRPAPMEDPMLRSGLLLAGADRFLKGEATPPDLDNGVLTSYEATSLDLQGTELVVLSACETGLGQVQDGEGVFGLRRAFQEAGAESVLMSMWSVPDQETQELMTLFYSKWLSGKDKHIALREAQLELREKVKARYGKDAPFYWGAFVLVGQ